MTITQAVRQGYIQSEHPIFPVVAGNYWQVRVPVAFSRVITGLKRVHNDEDNESGGWNKS